MELSARGGLEPHFRVLFSAIFQVFPWGISTRGKTVECSGSKTAANCCKSTYNVFVCFNHMSLKWQSESMVA